MTDDEKKKFAFGVNEPDGQPPAEEMPDFLIQEELAARKEENKKVFDRVVAEGNTDYARVLGTINAMPGPGSSGEASVASMASRIYKGPEVADGQSEQKAIVDMSKLKPLKKSLRERLFGK